MRFHDDQLCIADRKRVRLFEFFRFDKTFHLEQKLCHYRKKPTAIQFVKFDADGDYVAIGCESDIKIFSTATLDVAFEKTRNEKGPSSCVWSKEMFLVSFGRRFHIYNHKKNFVLHKNYFLPSVNVLNEAGNIQVFKKELRLAVSQYHRSMDHVSVALEAKCVDMEMAQNIPIFNNKIVLTGENSRVYFVDRAKIVESQREKRKNALLALKIVRFANERKVPTDYLMTLAEHETNFVIFNDHFQECSKILCIRGEQQRMKNFDVDVNQRIVVTMTQTTVDMWRIPAENQPIPRDLGVPFRSFSTSISSLVQKPVIIYLEEIKKSAVAIPRDDNLFISEGPDAEYQVALNNNARELINTTHLVKEMGKLTISNLFYTISRNRDENDEVLHTYHRYAGEKLPWKSSVLCRRKYITAVNEYKLGHVLIGGLNEVLIISLNSISGRTVSVDSALAPPRDSYLVRTMVNGSVACIAESNEHFILTTFNNQTYLMTKSLDQIDIIPIGAKQKSKSVLYKDQLVIFRDHVQPLVITAKLI